MPSIIISDTSCLIVLSNIGELDLLHKLYGEVITTPEIANEFGTALPEWVKIINISNKNSQQILEMQVDKGEASAIALAIEYPESLIILDDYKARKVAHRLGINFTGTLGVIIKAKNLGIIPSIKPLLEKISNTNFRLSEELEHQALLAAGELY